ncbi:hypothetical protein EIP91_006440, partial [Steccherinum ochraceum]
MKLSACCCSSLRHIPFVLFIAYKSLGDIKKSSSTLRWRYILRSLASAPKIVRTVTLLTDSDMPFEDLPGSTVDTVDT